MTRVLMLGGSPSLGPSGGPLGSTFLEDVLHRGFQELLGASGVKLLSPGSDNLGLDLASFDHVLLCSPWRLHNSPVSSLVPKLLKAVGPKIAVVDDSDDPFIRRIGRNPAVSVYFKREYPLANHLTDGLTFGAAQASTAFGSSAQPPGFLLKASGLLPYYYSIMQTAKSEWARLCRAADVATKLYPLSICYVSDPRFRIAEKHYDISFVATLNNSRRLKIARLVENLSKERGLRSFISVRNVDDPLPYESYLNVISASKLSIAPRGRGQQTYRFWEITALGAALLAERITTYIPDIFVEDVEAAYFDNLGELEEKILRTLDGDNWRSLASNALEKTQTHHRPLIRARHVLDVMERLP